MLQQTIGRLPLQKGLLAGDKCLDYTYPGTEEPSGKPRRFPGTPARSTEQNY